MNAMGRESASPEGNRASKYREWRIERLKRNGKVAVEKMRARWATSFLDPNMQRVNGREHACISEEDSTAQSARDWSSTLRRQKLEDNIARRVPRASPRELSQRAKSFKKVETKGRSSEGDQKQRKVGANGRGSEHPKAETTGRGRAGNEKP